MARFVQPVPPGLAQSLAAGIAETNAEHRITREDFGFFETADGRTIGGITGALSFGVLFIGNLWIAPGHRRQGLGRTLMAAAETYGREHGAAAACVDTLSTQAPAFYTTLGYSELGRISGTTTVGPVDRIWFKKAL